MSRFNYQSNMKLLDRKIALQKILIASYFKVFINFCQTNAIVQNIGLNMNNVSMSYLMDFFNLVAGNLHQIISLECLLESKSSKL